MTVYRVRIQVSFPIDCFPDESNADDAVASALEEVTDLVKHFHAVEPDMDVVDVTTNLDHPEA